MTPQGTPSRRRALRGYPLVALLAALSCSQAAPDAPAANASPAADPQPASQAQAAPLEVLSLRDRADFIDRNLEQRFETVLPALMRREGIDLWLILSREYNEDPVLRTMLPAEWMSARRHTVLLIHDPGEGRPLERLAVARYAVGELFDKAWDKEAQPDQWRALAGLIAARDPAAIGINRSRHFGLADGLSSTEFDLLTEALGPALAGRMVSAERLAIAWLESRSDLEMTVYPALAAQGHRLIARAFSREVVTPGETTTDDIVWWLRQQSLALGLGNWFHPTVSIQRAEDAEFDQVQAFSARAAANTVLPGDLLHVDFGLTYLRLNTDQQQHAYVLRPGERDAPEGLQRALRNGNRLQDLLTAEFATGRSGNQVLARARQRAIDEGLKPAIYTHPLGFHGHGAGPTIGMWDQQQGVPVAGDYPLYRNTAYSIELNAASEVPEWGREIRIMLEEDAYFDGERVHYLSGRQQSFHLIHSD